MTEEESEVDVEEEKEDADVAEVSCCAWGVGGAIPV